VIGIDWKSLDATTLVGRVCQSGSDLRARRACQPTRACGQKLPVLQNTLQFVFQWMSLYFFKLNGLTKPNQA
jgi:hypothetical protein